MIRFPVQLILVAAAATALAAPASANELTFLVSAGTIEGWNLFSPTCHAGLSNCGIYGVGLIGVAGETVVSSSISIPGLGTNDAWTAKSGTVGSHGGVGIEAHDVMGGKIAFITTDTTISTANKTYKTLNPSTGPAMGVAAVGAASGSAVTTAGIISASTDLQIVIDFADVALATETLNLEFVGLQFKADGSQWSTIDTTHSVTLTASGVSGNPLSSAPEPSSFGLILAGAMGIGVLSVRRFRRTSVSE